MENKLRQLPAWMCVVLLLVLMVGIVLIPSQTGAEDKEIQVQINGEPLMTDVAPVMIDGRVMVPFKAIFTALGVTDISWEEVTKTVKAVKDETTIELQIDQATAKVNGQAVTLDVTPQIVNGRTLVPARFVAETLDMDVQWVPKIDTVIIKPKEADIAYFENRYMRVPLTYGLPAKMDEYSYMVMWQDASILVKTEALPLSDFGTYVKMRATIVEETFGIDRIDRIGYKGKTAYRIDYVADDFEQVQVLDLDQPLEDSSYDLPEVDMELHYRLTISQDDIGNIHQFVVFSDSAEKLEQSYREKVIPFMEDLEYVNTHINYVDPTYQDIVTENFALTTRAVWDVIPGSEAEDVELYVELNFLSVFTASNSGKLEEFEVERADIEELATDYYYHLEEIYSPVEIWYDEYEYKDYYMYEIYLEHEEELTMYDGTKVSYMESVAFLIFENKHGEVIATKFYTPAADFDVTYDYYVELLEDLEIRDTLSKSL